MFSMQKEIRIISIILLIISLLVLPFLGIVIAFGLAGSTTNFFLLIGISYITLIISLVVSIFKYKVFPLVILSIVIMGIGFNLDSNFWEEQNSQLCEDLRSDPTCVEDECGFSCSDFQGHGGFSTSGGICKNKDMSSC